MGKIVYGLVVVAAVVAGYFVRGTCGTCAQDCECCGDKVPHVVNADKPEEVLEAFPERDILRKKCGMK